MLLLLVVSLYTSRVILKVLGIDDYGIYNLIAGFVTFLTFITNSLVSAMQRYFNVALGKNDLRNYRDVFSMSINILALFSCLILVLGETVGLWFVMNHLNIPPDRYNASLWVYQFSLLTFVANTLRTPFHASIIAHEQECIRHNITSAIGTSSLNILIIKIVIIVIATDIIVVNLIIVDK